MSLRFFSYAALTALVAVTLIFFSKPIATFIVELVSPPPPGKGTPVGQVVEVIGEVFYREARVPTAKPIREPLPLELHQQDAVLVRTGSMARLMFQGGAEINVLEESEILVEFFNPQDPLSPVYLTLRRGDLEIKKPGVAGRLFIVKDKQVLSLPEWTASVNEPSKTVTVDDTPTVSVEPSATTSTKSAGEITKATGESVENTAPVIDIGGGQQTLSSAYIETTLTNKSQQFRRCQINSVRDRLPAMGQMLFSIRIEPSGKVGNVRQLSSTIDNLHLTNCVTDVIQRTVFRSYAGKAITLSYPIDFQ